MLFTRSLKRQFSLVHNSRTSKDSELIVLEGHRTILEAVNAGLSPVTFIFSRLNLLLDFPLDKFKDTAFVQVRICKTLRSVLCFHCKGCQMRFEY